MDPYCRGCAYRQKITGGGTNCGYCIITGYLRECPPGSGCIRKARKLSKKQSAKYRHSQSVMPIRAQK